MWRNLGSGGVEVLMVLFWIRGMFWSRVGSTNHNPRYQGGWDYQTLTVIPATSWKS